MDNREKFSKTIQNFGHQSNGRSSPHRKPWREEISKPENFELELTDKSQDAMNISDNGAETESDEYGTSWGGSEDPENFDMTREIRNENNGLEQQTLKKQIMKEGLSYSEQINARRDSEGSYDTEWELERAMLGIMQEQVTVGMVSAQENALVMEREDESETMTAGKIRRSYIHRLQVALKELETKMISKAAERYKRELTLRNKPTTTSQTEVGHKPESLLSQVMPRGRLSDLQRSVRLQNPQLLDECSDFLTFPFQYHENNRIFHPDGEVITGVSDPTVHKKLNQSFIRGLTSRQERSTPPHFLAVLSTEAVSYHRNRVGYKEVDEIVAFGATVIRGAGNRLDQPISVEKGNFHGFFYPHNPSGEELNFQLDFPEENNCQATENRDTDIISSTADPYDTSAEEELAEQITSDAETQRVIDEAKCLALAEISEEKEKLLSIIGRRDARDFFQWVKDKDDCKERCMRNRFGKWVAPLCKALYSGRTISLLRPFLIDMHLRLLPAPYKLRSFNQEFEYGMSENWQEEVETLYLLLRNLEMSGITFVINKVDPPTPFQDDSSASSDEDDDETMSTGSDCSMDREKREAITSAFIHYADISKFTKKAANRLKKCYNHRFHFSKQDPPQEYESEMDESVFISASEDVEERESATVAPQTPLDHNNSLSDKYASLEADSPSARRAQKQPVGYQEEDLRYLTDSDDETSVNSQEFFRNMQVYNYRTTIKKPIIPLLTEEEKFAPQYAKRTGGPPLPSLSYSTLTYQNSDTNENDEERTIVSDELPFDESDNMEVDQLADDEEDSDYEENNDGYSVLRDKKGRVFLRDPMKDDRNWESEEWEGDDKEFKSEAMEKNKGTQAPSNSPVNDVTMPSLFHTERTLEDSMLTTPVNTMPQTESRNSPLPKYSCILTATDLERNAKAMAKIGDMIYHKSTNERDELGYTDHRNYQHFMVNPIPRELSRYIAHEPIPPGHLSLAEVDVLGTNDNHPLRKFDNAASICSVMLVRDQLDEMVDHGLGQRIEELKRFGEDLTIDVQQYQNRISSSPSAEEWYFGAIQVHNMRAEYDRRERNHMINWGTGQANSFISIFEHSNSQLTPSDPTLNIVMMHLF
ncbi:hypothetical protein C8J56DRAFT_1050911 [Mycena floridula]|nr:hypothetical protein C8J56DRAFT_1050911 [Mycena floridula]